MILYTPKALTIRNRGEPSSREVGLMELLRAQTPLETPGAVAELITANRGYTSPDAGIVVEASDVREAIPSSV